MKFGRKQHSKLFFMKYHQYLATSSAILRFAKSVSIFHFTKLLWVHKNTLDMTYDKLALPDLEADFLEWVSVAPNASGIVWPMSVVHQVCVLLCTPLWRHRAAEWSRPIFQMHHPRCSLTFWSTEGDWDKIQHLQLQTRNLLSCSYCWGLSTHIFIKN